MSTEQEVAVVAEALERTDDAWQPRDINDENAPWGIDGDCSGLYEAQARAAIAAVNQHRAEQASAGDREAVDALIRALSRWEQTFATSYTNRTVWREYRQVYDNAPETKQVEAARAAVLARMQRPVIAVTEEQAGEALPLKPVFVKQGFGEVGIGSLEADRLWESRDDPEDGSFAHLARDGNGQFYFSLTDMEEFDGSYMSVRVTHEDINRLRVALEAALAPAPED